MSDTQQMATIQAILAELRIFRPGYACDVGANNGTFLSNTIHLEHLGWIVLCVEPNPRLEAEGRATRKLWRVVAAGPLDAEDQEFWMYNAAGGYASNSALAMPSGHVPYGEGPPPEKDRVRVSVRRLDRLLEEAGFPRLDVLTIDCEGYEESVLDGIDLERWQPAIILAEETNFNVPTPDGYTRRDKSELDAVFVRDVTTVDRSKP